jgi:8-oxo-dGTP pyrophosphatase MutT (NUDIX family)
MVTVQQVAVIPYQKSPALQVLLIRKLPDGEWGIPKGGILDHGNDYHEAGRMECLEEAGADGSLGSAFVGEFSYQRADKHFDVRVFLMEVTGLRDRYREIKQRERKWFLIEEAIDMLGREPLRWIVRELSQWVVTGDGPGFPTDRD